VEDTAVTDQSPDGPKPLLVLIVDDHEKNRRLARDVLDAAGFRTLEAANGADALVLADEHLPNVILMDLRLPDMDGPEVARRLAEGVRTTAIPVVALSSTPLDSADRLRSAGFAGYLEKPFTIRAFPEQVRRFCATA
jgi:two-component system cell cycle response regulator DivK